jgi:hypothetical protein
MNSPKILLARSIWLFNFGEINPLGIALTDVHQALRERYKFLQYPHRVEDFAKPALSYIDGAFSGLNVSLEIYSDGLIANTRTSTQTSDTFLDEVLSWARDAFKFRYDPLLVKTKAYESQIEFFSDINVNHEVLKLDSFIKTLNSISPEFEPNGHDVFAIVFKNEKRQRPSFTFERRENVPFSENRYFSSAACTTEKHLQLIEDFERIFKNEMFEK